MRKSIPWNRLLSSSLNARKTARNAGVSSLAASIAAHGLLQNLNVIPAPGQKGFYEVIAGERRRLAIGVLVEAGTCTDNVPVECQVHQNFREAKEASLAENEQRVAMNPADAYVAFAYLIEDGHTPEGIARRFGLDVRLVNQRLKLGRLSPQLLDLLRDGALTLDLAKAFTVTDDHAAQEAVYAALSQQRWSFRPETVRQHLTEQDVAATSGLGRFVREEYLAGGHPTKVDLFAQTDESGTFFTDRAVALTIAQGKLSFEADRLVQEEGWLWAIPLLEWDNDAVRGCNRIHATGVRGLTDEEEVERARLLDEHETLRIKHGLDDAEGAESAPMSGQGFGGDDDEVEDGDDTDAELNGVSPIDGADAARMSEIEARLDELEALADESVFTAAERAKAGVVAYLLNGEIQHLYGYVRPEDVAEEGAAHDGNTGTSGAVNDDAASGGNVVALPPVEARGLYSQALIDDLCAIRTQAFQVTLAQHPDHALSLVLWRLWCSLTCVYGGDSPTSVTAYAVHPKSSQSNLDDSPAAQALEAIRRRFHAMLTPAEDSEGPTTRERLFDAIHVLPTDQKLALLAYLTALTVQVPLGAHGRRQDGIVERMGVEMGVDVAASLPRGGVRTERSSSDGWRRAV